MKPAVSDKINDNFSQLDIVPTILDYLALPIESELGRSMIRDYYTFRPMVFANIFKNSLIFIIVNKMLLCHARSIKCTDVKTPNIIVSSISNNNIDSVLEQRMKDLELLHSFLSINETQGTSSKFISISDKNTYIRGV